MTSAQKTLRVISIIIVVFAVIGIILGLLGMAGGGILGAASSTTEVSNELAKEGYTSSDGAAAGILVMVGGLVVIISAVIDLIVGILGMRGAKDPSKIGAFFVICIIGIVLAVLSLISAIGGGSDASSILSNVISLVLIIWCFYLANKIKNEGAPLE